MLGHLPKAGPSLVQADSCSPSCDQGKRTLCHKVQLVNLGDGQTVQMLWRRRRGGTPVTTIADFLLHTLFQVPCRPVI